VPILSHVTVRWPGCSKHSWFRHVAMCVGTHTESTEREVGSSIRLLSAVPRLPALVDRLHSSACGYPDSGMSGRSSTTARSSLGADRGTCLARGGDPVTRFTLDPSSGVT